MLVAIPSEAVTLVVIVFNPTNNAILAEGELDNTADPFTVTFALGSVNVGVTVMAFIVLATLAV